ncbi:hypothetical protein D3C87_940370 [compost metagenome]
MSLRITLAAVAMLPLVLSKPAFAQSSESVSVFRDGVTRAEAVRPTRYFGPSHGENGRLQTPGFEEANVLPPGSLMGMLGTDPARELNAGVFWGVLPNLELGTQFRGMANYGTLQQAPARTSVQGKYRLLGGGALSISVLGQATHWNWGNPESSYWEGAIGLPISYAPFDFFAVDLIPITPLGFRGVTFAHGLGIGARLRLLPSLWLQGGDHFGIGTGPTHVFSAGVRFEPWPGVLAVDANLLNYMHNTGSPGLQTGTFGITSYFGGKLWP